MRPVALPQYIFFKMFEYMYTHAYGFQSGKELTTGSARVSGERCCCK